jgi:hypothetical protein
VKKLGMYKVYCCKVKHVWYIIANFLPLYVIQSCLMQIYLEGVVP